MTEKKIEKKPVDWRIVVIAIICLTALELGAMFNGVNGRLFSLIVAAIAALAGLSLPQLKLRGH